MAHFIYLDAVAFEAWLVSQGFSKTTSNYEAVFVKQITNPLNLQIILKVYSSIREGDVSARDVGKDAIRVIAFAQTNDARTFPLYKGKRIHRTTSIESIQERVLERINEATIRCNEWIKEREQKSLAKINPSSHSIGNPGDTIRLNITVLNKKQYGQKYLFIMADSLKNQFIFWSERDVLQVGEEYSMRCTIVAHRNYNGIMQTEITNAFGSRIVK